MNTKQIIHLPLLIGCLLAPPPALPQTVAPCVTIACPPDLTIECSSPTGAVATFSVSARTACGRIATVTCRPPSGSLFAPGSTPVDCEAVDDLRNTARCQFHVNAVDRTPPTLTVPPPISVPCAGPAGAVVTYETMISDDCDSTPRLACTPSSGSVFPTGTTTVQCVGVDAAGNRSFAQFPVTVVGECSPDCLAIDCPRDLLMAVRFGSSRVVPFDVTASNRCSSQSVSVFCRPPSGSAFPIGTTTVQCSATNVGAVQKCSFHVTVQDLAPPVLRTPQTLTLPCQGFGLHLQAGAALTYPVTATDNTDPHPQIACTPPNGAWLPLGTNPVTCVATDVSGNAATNQFVVIVQSGPKCEASVPVTELSPDNWGFELGLTSWSASGSAFEHQPVIGNPMQVKRIPDLKQQMDDNIGGGYWQALAYRIGYRGQRWIGTADNYAVPQGGLFDLEQPDESLTGELRSKPFVIGHRYITFLVGGTYEPDNVRVELLVEAAPGTPNTIHIGITDYQIEYHTSGHGRELLRRGFWSTDIPGHKLIGRKAMLRIIDQSTSGHVNVDDFQFTDAHPSLSTVSVGGSEFPAVVTFDGQLYDWDSPVWGMADLHTHPMSHLGFGEGVMHGQPDGGAANPANIALALPDCNCLHGGWDLFNNQCGNYLRQALQMGTDSVGNDSHREGWSSDRIMENGIPNDYGRFRHWPVFSTKTHQQMWYEWIKRAYDGGLRTMVALCVNNSLLGSASQGPGPIDDLTVGDHQIQAMKEFAARHDDFMEIAYDPFQLRDIVRRNKLAVILGSELDDIGNLVRNENVQAWIPQGASSLDAYSKHAVTVAIQHMYTNGIRYIFPVHLVNNKFGGTPIANAMLNIANRFMNGHALVVEPADFGDHIRYWLPEDFDLDTVINEHQDELILGAVALPAVLPLLPAITDIFGSSVGIPPGSGSAIGAGLLPVALLAGVDLLPGVLQAIPPDVWPIHGHYPHYPGKASNEAPWGHRNARGLTDLGEFAIREMMKRGMMIDVDHMSQKTLQTVFQMAEANPIGYPLNSGHNNFRPLADEESAENHRSGEQMDHLRELGGLFGVGCENANTASLSEVWVKERNFSVSDVDNDCAGTSKTVSQVYLYALEAMGGQRVALGTDLNGFIAGPGPRFGPNSDFANHSPWHKAARIRNQDDGVLYSPKHGRPLVGPVFSGAGVDPDKDWGFGSHQHLDEHGNLKPAYAYSKEQRDFFPAIRIFHYLQPKVSGGWSQDQTKTELDRIVRMLDGGYDNGAVADFAFGLIKGIKAWAPEGFRQEFGRMVYQQELLAMPVPDYVQDSPDAYETLFSLRAVWYDYHQAFGKNPALKRCQTGPKDWDINFEGVAHYGMLPDLLQDMVNVGMVVSDLNPLFQSSDDFALMWTKTLRAADALARPNLYISANPSLFNGLLQLEWYAEPGDQLEESSGLGPRAIWRLAEADVRIAGGRAKATVRVDPNGPPRFFRVRK